MSTGISTDNQSIGSIYPLEPSPELWRCSGNIRWTLARANAGSMSANPSHLELFCPAKKFGQQPFPQH